MTDSPMLRLARTLAAFRDMSDEGTVAAVATPSGGAAKLTYGDARTLLQQLLNGRERLDRIISWHSRETGPGGMVGDFCNECGHVWPCDTRRMAEGTYEDDGAGVDAPHPQHVTLIDDGSGDPPAVVHGDQPLTPEGEAAMRNLIAAAKRQFAADLEADPSIGERQEAAVARIRDRVARLRGGVQAQGDGETT